MDLKYYGVAIGVADIQKLLSVGFPIAMDIIEELVKKEELIKVDEHKYIFKEQIKIL